MKSKNSELIIASLDVIYFVINTGEVYFKNKTSMYRQSMYSLKGIDFVTHLTQTRNNEEVYKAAVSLLQ